MKTLSALTLVLMLAATSVWAECTHISQAAPIVTAWTIAGHSGGFTIDARIARRFGGDSPAATYCAVPDENFGTWSLDLAMRPAGSGGTYTAAGLCPVAVVTDSTFHADVSCPAGEYEYVADVDGQMQGELERCDEPVGSGTFTIPAATAALRASWGAVRARWGAR